MQRTHACYAAACHGGETVALSAEPVNISFGYTGRMRLLCTWVITGVPPIELEFISFATTENFVTVYRGNGTDILLKQFSGRDLPARFKVRASMMTVTFTTSNGYLNTDGFVAVLKATGGCAPAAASVPPHSHALQPHKRQLHPPRYLRVVGVKC